MQKLALALTVALLLACGQPLWASQAGQIDAITPAAARRGESVTIKGNGLGARNVRITVGGVPAVVLSANGNQATFRVPDGVKPGMTQVVATNPGFQSGSIAFRMLEGILLPGDPAALLKDLGLALPAHGVDSGQIQNTILLTRIVVQFRADATVAQVNSLLQQIDGGVIGVAKGSAFLTIAVPRQDSIAAVNALVKLVPGFPGASFALPAQVGQSDQVFLPTPLDAAQVATELRHLLPGRFPAAWNALPPGIDGAGLCPVTPIQLLVADSFSATPPDGFSDAMPGVALPASPPSGTGEDHGYAVALVAAANVDGANPFIILGCLDVHLVQLAGQDIKTAIETIASATPPTGKFIVNLSQGYVSQCQNVGPDEPCIPPQDVLTQPFDRAAYAAYWKQQTLQGSPDFLIVASAGNSKGATSDQIYPGMGDSRYNSFATISQLPDTLFNFAADPHLWSPTTAFASIFDSLLPTQADFTNLQDDIRNKNLDGAGAVADNVIVVGSATTQSSGSVLTQHVTDDQLAESSFSDRGPDVLASGEEIFAQDFLTGTSFAAPQVAGLASYLWMLSPELQSQPTSITKRAIVANARNQVIDAYASVLSLDAAALPTPANAPIRKTLLDVNRDGGFNELDIDDFLSHFFVVAPDGTITRQAAPDTTADFSRYDLNGDGFTSGGSRRERFDLDRVGSTQFGPASYSVVSQNIEDHEVRFDESALTDLEILCYYAYSDMYQGDPDARKNLLAGRCGIAVQPANATVNSGRQLQFTAVTPSNDAVTWTVTPGCGTIDSASGLFTASTAGTCTVKATDTSDPNQTGTAIVTVQASAKSVALMQASCTTTAKDQTHNAILNQKTFLYQNSDFNVMPPLFAPPLSMPLNNPLIDSDYTYSADCRFDISPAEVASNAVSSGTLTAVTRVDTAQLAAGATAMVSPLETFAESGITLFALNHGIYQVTITGQMSEFFGFTGNTVSVCITTVNGCDLRTSLGLFSNPSNKSFSFTVVMAGCCGAMDPVSGQFLPSRIGIGLLSEAENSLSAFEAKSANSSVSLTFTIERIGTAPF